MLQMDSHAHGVLWDDLKVESYHVCQVCGYVVDRKAPDKCPVCGAPKEKFKTVEA
ncbi:MAG: hypothetical protein R6X10_10755 [Desulfobacterales bacterium]